jgi:nucleotide-binding universal stress UspA family protein
VVRDIETLEQWRTNTMYKRILTVLDDALQGDLPIEYAVALATSTGAELALLQVLTVPSFACGLDMAGCAPLCLDNIKEASDAGLTYAMAAAETYGVSYTVIRTWGAIPQTILKTATEADCDLIVVGALACPGWPRFLGASIAKKLVTQA